MSFIKECFLNLNDNLYSSFELENSLKFRIRMISNFKSFKKYELYLDKLKGIDNVYSGIGDLVISKDKAFFIAYSVFEDNGYLDLYNIKSFEPFFDNKFNPTENLLNIVNIKIINSFSIKNYLDLKISIACSFISTDRLYTCYNIPDYILEKSILNAKKKSYFNKAFEDNSPLLFIYFLRASGISLFNKISLNSLNDLNILNERIERLF